MINNLGLNIRNLLLDQNISAYAVERRAGLKPSVLQNILQGRSKRPGIDVVAAIAKELGCSIEFLIGEKNPSPVTLKTAEGIFPLFDLQLLEAISTTIFSILKKQRTTIRFPLFCAALEESYQYMAKLPEPKIDYNFIVWLVERFVAEDSKTLTPDKIEPPSPGKSGE
jgi:transcriptional regulator with XRE-family HTH domain